MVIFGGLELVAAGYLLHKHAKNNKEARRLEEEEERLRIEEEELRRERRRERHRRNHSHSPRRDGKHSYEYEPRHNIYEDRKSARSSRSEYLAPPATQPPRASSAPPQQQQQQQQQPVRDGYPSTGWPADWEQSRRPEPNTNLDRNANTDLNVNGYPQDVKYGWRDDQPHGESSTHHSFLRTDDGERRSRGRSDPREAAAPHVRFAPLPRDVDGDDDRAPRSPPPAYNG